MFSSMLKSAELIKYKYEHKYFNIILLLFTLQTRNNSRNNHLPGNYLIIFYDIFTIYFINISYFVERHKTDFLYTFLIFVLR